MTSVGVDAALGWFVALAEPDQVGCDHAMSGGNEQRDHLAIEVAPGRLTVHAQDGCGVGRPLVEVVHTKGAAVVVGDVDVVRRERIVGQSGEAFIGGAQGLHDVPLRVTWAGIRR